MNELLYNGSGIKDPTAYEALKHLGKDEDMKAQKFEIWKAKDNGPFDRTWAALIIKDAVDYYVVYRLYTEKEGSKNYAVQGKSGRTWYTDINRQTYVYPDNVISKLDGLGQEAIDDVRFDIADALDLLDVVDVHDADGLPAGASYTTGTTGTTTAMAIDVSLELVKTKTERDTYKALYHDMLARYTEALRGVSK